MTIEKLYNEYLDLKNQCDGLKADLLLKENRLKKYERYNEQLEEALKLLRHRTFAPKSEKILPEQFVFNDIEVEASLEKDESDEAEQLDLIEVPSHKRKKPKRKKLSKDLPREIVTIELPLEQRKCPHDGTELKVIGKETSERIDTIPMVMKVIETHRLTYACPCCEVHVKTASVAPMMIPKGIATAGTLAFIATSKFCDGLSLYHIEKMYERNGVEISRGSMAHWMIRSMAMAQPILNLMQDDLLQGNYTQMDETPVQVLKEPGKKAQTKSYMWLRASPNKNKRIILFDYDPTRSGSVAQRLMEEFKGRLQCDGYDGYNKLESSQHIIRHGCMAHARRKFKEATLTKNSAGIAKHALKLIGRLYKIEEIIEAYSNEEKLKVRSEKAKPILDELKLWVEKHLHKVPPKSTTGKALMYFQNEYIYLARYLEDGQVYIDNNFIENKVRPFAIGRNRWLFSDSVEGAKASAALYSLVETAKANNLEPYRYLRYIFEKLPLAQKLSDYEELLPWNLKNKISTPTTN